ncbi:MAG: zinc metallopeptidase [Chloroflexota bacterium]|nr:zinc metallopeptidase [Anaerolineales bacterium]MCA9976862.1 zinc metallopeptidase [Anaerolineales bacterium]MCB8967178.1 zinc metallopeptidase [Ardenticatenaceae bacterium]
MFYFNPLYLVFALPGLLLGLWAQSRVKSAFSQYSRVRTLRNVAGAEVARSLLDSQGLYDVHIEQVQGTLSDHYDPRQKVLRLSQDVYRAPSIAAAGVAAHEMGHALQDAHGYAPLRMRSALVPAVQFGSTLGPWVFMGGLLLNFTQLAWVGVILFAASTVFALITLPVELDASRRAKQLLTSNGLLVGNEIDGVNKVLDAAAWTYVAAAVSSIGTLLYYVMLLTGFGRRD